MSEKLRLQEPIRSPLEPPRLITPLPYRSGTSFLAWAIVNNNQPVPDVLSKMTKIAARSEEHTSELQSLMRISYAVFCLKQKNTLQSLKTNANSTLLIQQ